MNETTQFGDILICRWYDDILIGVCITITSSEYILIKTIDCGEDRDMGEIHEVLDQDPKDKIIIKYDLL